VTDPTVPVKVDVGPLVADTRYFYRVTDAAGATAEGTFRTPAAEGFHGLRFGVSGDWRGELRPYPSVANAAGENLDFFVALGDTVYADVPSIDFPGPQA
jgi:phosphodiesterase/alkaline phosphatase D-like protein